MDKVQNPNARDDFLMQAAIFLGRTSSATPEELDLALRQNYAKNYDPAKVARGQTPVQRAAMQAKNNPPPVPQQNPKDKKTEKEPDMPSLKSLAAQEKDPHWKKNNLPSPDELEKSQNGKGEYSKSNSEQEKDDDIPLANPNDVKLVQKKPAKSKSASSKSKEIDMDKFGTKEPTEKPAKSKSSTLNRVSGTKSLPMPSFGQVLRSQMKSQNYRTGLPKWKVGQTVDVGNSKGYKVTNRTANYYNLEKNGEKYVFVPFKGLKKVS